MPTPKRVALADLLSGQEAAEMAGLSYASLRVLLGRSQFPPPVRTSPSLWLRQDVARWQKTRG
jgi:predicted DNA-binding transcriptional regulator AlpA